MLGFNDLSTPLKAIIALAFVLILVVIAGLLLRRIAGGRLTLSGQGGRSRQPRLGVVDIFELDRQRQLVLLRRDNVEHLVMIGGPNDVVIEPSIVRGQSRAASQPPAQQAEGTEPQAIAAPGAPPQLRVARQETARGELPLAERTDAKLADAKPSLAPAAAVAGMTAGAAAAGAAAAGAAAMLAAGRAAEPTPAAPRATPSDTDMTSDTALGGPLGAPEPALQPLEPVVEVRRLPEFLRQDVRYGERAPNPDAAVEAATAVNADSGVDSGVSTPAPSPLRAEAFTAPAVEPLAGPDMDGSAAPRTIDIADQLAAELEALVAQPLPPHVQPSAVQPAPLPPAPPPTGDALAPAPVADQPADAPPEMPRPDAAEELARELERMLGASAQPIAPSIPMQDAIPERADPPATLAPAIDAAPVETTPAGADSAAIDFESELAKAIERPSLDPEPAAEPVAPEPASPEPLLAEPSPREPLPHQVVPPEPASAEAAPAQPAADDPFSVDAIEAEFARLLNRPINR